MLKTQKRDVWAFDLEWVPDTTAGRLLYGLSESDTTEEDVMAVMWRHGGATVAEPKPYLKTILCRVVSICVVRRRETSRGVMLSLTSLPREPGDPDQAHEGLMLQTFLDALGARSPQLVGYNSLEADLKILVQRAVVNGISARDFCRRPDGEDYFAQDSEWNVDLMRIVGGTGKGSPSLHEIATLSGIPGKIGVNGGDVADLWLRGEHRVIIDYNECDAVTTYLLWLRMAHFAGQFSAVEYETEQQRVRTLLEEQSRDYGKVHLAEFLDVWDQLRPPSIARSKGPAASEHAGTNGLKTLEDCRYNGR